MVVLGATDVHSQAALGVQSSEGIRIVPFVQAQLGVAREFQELRVPPQPLVPQGMPTERATFAAHAFVQVR